MRPEIEGLLHAVGKQSWASQIKKMAQGLPYDFEKAFNDLKKLDSLIPGLGQHNVNETAPDGHWTGIYRIEDRSIFRGIQYVGMHLGSFNNLEWYTRTVVIDSCYHVENSLKKVTGIIDRLSVGMILHRIERHIPFERNLYDALWELNRVIYNNAKHSIEDITMDGHMFSIEDAIAVYFVCRILGSRLLRGSGITTKHGNLVFPQDASYI
jgi:hypothetical protein